MSEPTQQPLTKDHVERLKMLMELGDKDSIRELGEIIRRHPEVFGPSVDFLRLFLDARREFVSGGESAIGEIDDEFVHERFKQFEPGHCADPLERMLIDLVVTTDLRAEAFAYQSQQPGGSNKSGMGLVRIANAARSAAISGTKALDKYWASDEVAAKIAAESKSRGPSTKKE